MNPVPRSWGETWPTLLAAMILFLFIIAVLTAMDRWVFHGPDYRTSVENSVTNGENLCENDRAFAEAVRALSKSLDLSQPQQDKVDAMVTTAEACEPPEEEP